MEIGLCIPVPVTAAGAVPGIPSNSGYCGLVARATAAGVIEVRDGSDTGVLLDSVSFAAAGQAWSFFGDAPIFCSGRIWITLVSGALPAAMSVRYR